MQQLHFDGRSLCSFFDIDKGLEREGGSLWLR